MKKLKKAISMILAALTVTSTAVSLAACGSSGGGGSNSSTDVEIYMWKSGLGDGYIKEAVKAFNKVQDKYNVTVESDSNSTTIMSSLDLGKSNTYDLYFTILNTTQYNKNFVELSDLLDSNAYGEEVTIRSKYNSAVLNGVKEADGTYKTLTYGGGFYGIVYNTAMIAENKLPRTTDELNVLTAELAGEDKKAWILFNEASGNGYWNNMLYTWAAQYDGLDYYNNNLLQLKDEAGNSPSKEVLIKKDGRYKALKVFEQLLTPSTVHGLSTSTNFTNVQNTFMNGGAAMMVNGSWLINESQGSANVMMMKNPVISSIVEKLEYRYDGDYMEDTMLAEIVTAIDNGETSFEGVSENDFNRIKTARCTMFNNACEQYVFIPSYSPAVEGAKEFLKFFYSDEGMKIYIEQTGLTPTLKFTDSTKFDPSTLSAWNYKQYEFANSMIYLTDLKSKSSVFTSTTLNQIGSLTYGQALINTSTNDRKNAEQLWTMMVDRVEELWNS